MLSGTASGYNRRFSRETFRLNLANVAEGTADDSGARVRTRLAAQGRRLPILGNSDASPQPRVHQADGLDYDFLYLRGAPSDREVEHAYGQEWAKAFHYLGPTNSKPDSFISQHEVPLQGSVNRRGLVSRQLRAR